MSASTAASSAAASTTGRSCTSSSLWVTKIVTAAMNLMYHALMRTVTVHDADELAELEMKLFPENCLNEHTLAKEIAAGSGWCFSEAGDIVAFVLCRGSDYLIDIMRLGVLPAYRRRGLASQLLVQAMGQASYAMLTVLPGNEDALRLYHRHGFEIVGRLQPEGWVMGATRPGSRSHFIGLDL